MKGECAINFHSESYSLKADTGNGSAFFVYKSPPAIHTYAHHANQATMGQGGI